MGSGPRAGPSTSTRAHGRDDEAVARLEDSGATPDGLLELEKVLPRRAFASRNRSEPVSERSDGTDRHPVDRSESRGGQHRFGASDRVEIELPERQPLGGVRLMGPGAQSRVHAEEVVPRGPGGSSGGTFDGLPQRGTRSPRRRARRHRGSTRLRASRPARSRRAIAGHRPRRSPGCSRRPRPRERLRCGTEGVLLPRAPGATAEPLPGPVFAAEVRGASAGSGRPRPPERPRRGRSA